MKNRYRSQDERGFTLVETVVALIVISLGILCLSAVFPLMSRDVGKSGVNTRALKLCQEKLEDLHMLPYDSPELTAGADHEDDSNPIDGVYTRTWTVADNQPIAGCKRVTVDVSWESYSGGSVTLATVIASTGR